MTERQAFMYRRGYLTKLAEKGADPELVARMAEGLGFDSAPDTPENDYGAGIADMVRDTYKPGKVMAHKQRRFDRDWHNASGPRKVLMALKHPVRSQVASSRVGVPVGTMLAALIGVNLGMSVHDAVAAARSGKRQ